MKVWLKTNKWKVIVPVLILAVLAVTFWYGGNAPGLQGWDVSGQTPQETTPAQLELESEPAVQTGKETETAVEESPAAETEKDEARETDETGARETAQTDTTGTQQTQPAQTETKPAETTAETGLASRPGGTEGGMDPDEKLAAAASLAGADGSSPGVEDGDKNYSESQGMKIDASTGKDQYLTNPVPEGKPVPVEPQDVVITDEEHTCTLSISCATINDNLDWLDPEKVELVPADGWILKPTKVTFYEGESVFNVLLRTCKQQRIHMEYEDTPIYNSAYIEGIHNLYEFDCGELSGWMYKVNDWFPNYGCSRYQLQEGDVVDWVFTCNLGIDVGGYYAAAG